MSRLWGDLRFVVRSLTRRPLSALVIIATLAVGVGATTAIFSVVQGVLLRPLPYPGSERLMLVMESNPGLGYPIFSVSALNYRDFRDRNQSFEALALVQTTSLSLTGDGDAERLQANAVSGEFFGLLGLRPLLGRTVEPADDRPGAPRVAVLAYGLWQRRFGGERGVLGSTIELSGEPYEVIGVLPPDSYPVPRDVFVPLALDIDASERGEHLYAGIGRLAAGVSPAGAQADLASIAASLAQEHPDSNEGWGTVVTSLHGWYVRQLRPALLLLLAAVAVLLLIAAVNAANLLLARLVTRERELAVRAALGAARGDLVRAVLLESLLLTLTAGLLGLAVAAAGLRLLLDLYAGDLPLTAKIGLDPAVLLFAVGLSAAVGLLIGLLPALRASNPDLRAALADGGGGAGHRGRRLRGALVVVEVALSVVLLAGAGLLFRSFTQLATVETGFDSRGALAAQFRLDGASYPDDERRAVFLRRLEQRLQQQPGVRAAGIVSLLPLAGGDEAWTYYIDGRPRPRPGNELIVSVRAASAGYREAMGIPLRQGRWIEPRDDERARRVVVIGETLARQQWPGESPLGRRLHLTFLGDEPPVWWEVVGVVGDVQGTDLSSPPRPMAYVPAAQATRPYSAIVVRSDSAPAALAEPLRRLMRELDPGVALFDVRSLEAIVDDSLAGPRFNAALVGVFAALALLLAAIGVYGVIAYGVEQRRGELAVRRAFGADGRRIVGLVVGQGMRLVVLGFGFGLLGAWLTTGWLRAMLHGVGAADPTAWIGVMAVLAVVGLAACWLPARSAARTDPWTVLREQ